MTLPQSIIATLAYHDIFSFPLKDVEVHKYMIGHKATLNAVQNNLKKLVHAKKILKKSGYFSLNKRSKIVSERIVKKRYSTLKFQKAVFYSKLLRFIPSIKLLAISGALAMENSIKDDDIDLVVVTSVNYLWTTRFLANIVLFPVKRSPTKSNLTKPIAKKGFRDKACLNLFLDESSLKIKEQNIYTAHEICQMRLLWDRRNTYNKFIKSNAWVKKFLPNWEAVTSLITNDVDKTNRSQLQKKSPKQNIRSSRVERFLKNIQHKYMESKITSEKIGEGQLFFHPHNIQGWVISEYGSRLNKLGFPKHILQEVMKK